MKTETPQTVRLKDYAPPAFLIDTVDLDFVIETGATTVRATLALRRNPAAAPGQSLILDGEELETLAVKVDGKNWPKSETPTTLTLNDLPDTFALQTVVRIQPEKNTRLSGLYRSKDGYFTQCEPHGFRSITWFIDRPDVMSTFTVTLHADEEKLPVLLANGNPVAAGDEAGGRHWATWNDPFRKPAYLFAVVAGKLDVLRDTFTTASGRDVQLAIYVEPVVTGRATYTGSPRGQLPFYLPGRLGGFGNMSAFARGQILGDEISYVGVGAEQIIGTFLVGLRGDMRLGFLLEGAHVGAYYTETNLGNVDILNSAAIYVGGETPFGPAYLGFGYSTNGVSNLFLNIGIQ